MRPTASSPTTTTAQCIKFVMAVPQSPPNETYVAKMTAATMTPANIGSGVSVLRMTPMTYASITFTMAYSVCTHRLVSHWHRRVRQRIVKSSPTVWSLRRR